MKYGAATKSHEVGVHFLPWRDAYGALREGKGSPNGSFSGSPGPTSPTATIKHALQFTVVPSPPYCALTKLRGIFVCW